MRKSLELELAEWEALARLARATHSLTTTSNKVLHGQPSWRVLIQRLAGSEKARESVTEILYKEWLEEVVFNWQSRCDELPAEEVTKWQASLTEAERRQWDAFFEARPVELESRRWHIARGVYYRRSMTEAARLGYSPQPDFVFPHNRIVIVDAVQGYDAGKDLIQEGGFETVKGDAPNSMWDPLAWRRDGDAVIGVIGDDRGWAGNWWYFLVVAWSPARLAGEYDDDYCLAQVQK